MRVFRSFKSVIVLLSLSLIFGCVPAYDKGQDINAGWEGITWGESEKLVNEKLSLTDADRTPFGEYAIIIKSGLVRTLGDFKVNAQPVISANKLVGVILLRKKPLDKKAEINQIKTIFTEKYGQPSVQDSNAIWKYKDMTFQLSDKNNSFLVVITNIKHAEAAVRNIVEPN
ncbi:hypothetical protein [Aliiglaciecola lipolytica]|uniref:Lipoprotein n=1 Tax=Aliiglaciecola lipolytica E3 TaxID=1127673 RepID=K6XTA3_9ALTE|nr:hypothetical protein [Aliiglaciecola lipolytica]GAC14901.1 hypothetical protein GLIP_2273 [Aliiglaciecola lipolytica E3]